MTFHEFLRSQFVTSNFKKPAYHRIFEITICDLKRFLSCHRYFQVSKVLFISHDALFSNFLRLASGFPTHARAGPGTTPP